MFWYLGGQTFCIKGHSLLKCLEWSLAVDKHCPCTQNSHFPIFSLNSHIEWSYELRHEDFSIMKKCCKKKEKREENLPQGMWINQSRKKIALANVHEDLQGHFKRCCTHKFKDCSDKGIITRRVSFGKLYG